MDFAIIWISFAILSTITTLIVYALVIPARIRKLPEPEQEATYNRSRKRFYYVQLVWLTAVLATGIIISNIGLILFSIFGFCWTYLAFAIYFFYKSDEIDKMDARQQNEVHALAFMDFWFKELFGYPLDDENVSYTYEVMNDRGEFEEAF